MILFPLIHSTMDISIIRVIDFNIHKRLEHLLSSSKKSEFSLISCLCVSDDDKE